MNKKLFKIFGWILLFGMGISWIIFGYSSWYLLTLPLAYISFSIEDGRIKKLKKMKKITIQQVLLILLAFVVSVGVVFGLIQLANYLINDTFHLTGWVKSLSQFVAVILSLYPAKLIYGRVVYNVARDLSIEES